MTRSLKELALLNFETKTIASVMKQVVVVAVTAAVVLVAVAAAAAAVIVVVVAVVFGFSCPVTSGQSNT